MLRYDTEQGIAKQAGIALQHILDLGSFIPLSVLCHSMGNRVLMSYAKHATVQKRFENVYMVAADIWEEVFNTRVIRNTWNQPVSNYWNEWKDSGLKLSQMLKNGGKIHITNYSDDYMLKLSVAENRRTRLGRYGLAPQLKRGRVHPDVLEKIVVCDMDEFKEDVMKASPHSKHSYQTMPRLIKYYNSTMNASASAYDEVLTNNSSGESQESNTGSFPVIGSMLQSECFTFISKYTVDLNDDFAY